MEQIIFSLIFIVLICCSSVVFTIFAISNLKKINTKIDGIPKRYWSMGVYMDNIPQTEENTLHLGSVPLKIYEKGEYSDLPVPRVGELCFGGGWFIVMIETPFGQISNHYENKYWDEFHCEEKEFADKWDGHTEKDVIERLMKCNLQNQ